MVVFRNYCTDSFPATIHSFKKLRSLIVEGFPSSMNAALPDLIANLSCLRTLKLLRCGIEEVPSNIGKLIHLRHVDLSWNEIKELPEEICELYNMQTLDLSGCSELEKLPDNIGKLIRLRHLSVLQWDESSFVEMRGVEGLGCLRELDELYNMQTLDLSGCSELEKLPDNIGKLIRLRHLSVLQWDESSFVEMRGVEGLGCLRELDEFHVSGSGERSNIGGLKNLNHLQGCLRIRWLGDVKDPDEVKKAELKSKKNLTRLGLWFDSRTDRGMIHDDEILEALEPPPNIDSLTIRDYQGIIQVFPSWINKLRVVELIDWRKMENLHSLGKLPFLEKLVVRGMESVRKVGREFLGMEAAVADGSDIRIGEMTASPSNTVIAFPKLKFLWFDSLENWEEWEGEGRRNEDKTIMPSLRSLRIAYCPKLKALPDYIYQSTTLEKLNIMFSPILQKQFKEGGNGWPNTSHTPNITFTFEMF
ncbi:hypothetical protein OIU77_005480 [Salix suchowensis]|uniref:Uncharacterized protein n=1 Tax=Salix suchowensis TaxID=1278906 RepID=A0ABQ9APJ3_9ROSI|nr:hypothetical protein OIU77_005480 [Salix suchowensis]